MRTPPRNLVILTADELRADCTGYGGGADARTPNLDALAARSTSFSSHFTTFPKCVPARCSMFTGRAPHTDGLRTVSPQNHLPPGTPEFAGCLRSHGWQTAVLGLNHVWEDGSFYGSGPHKNVVGAGAVDWTSFTEDLGRFAMEAHDFPVGRARRAPAGLDRVGFRGLLSGKRDGFHDVNRTNQAIHWLRELRDPARPFFLQLNLSMPHPPYTAPEPFYSAFDPGRLAAFPWNLPSGAPLCLRAQRHWRLGDRAGEAAMREIRAVYLAMAAFMDSQIGRVLDALGNLGLESETVVIFTSDHGDYAGQHGLVEKWDTDFRDCLMHVPFLVSGPGIPQGIALDGLSDHTDLADTVLELIGIRAEEEWVRHGRSLLPMLSGGEGKSAVFASGGHEAAMRARFPGQADLLAADGPLGDKQRTYLECPESMARAKMVRTRDWKLVVRETGDDELYHIAQDPWEMNNLAGQPGTETATLDLQRLLIDWSLQTDPDRPILTRFGA